MKIAIVTISSGTLYNNLCKSFLKSLYNFFDSTVTKQVFIIGDDTSYLKNNELFYKIHELPAPLTATLKFFYIKQLKEELHNFDYILYFDADMELLQEIKIEELISSNLNEITVVKHPWANDTNNQWLLEHQSISTAAIDNVEQYYQNCFFSGAPDVFFNMTNILNENINTDFMNRYIARWYDESHFNKFIHDKPKKVLSKNYAYPDVHELNSDVKIIHRNLNTKPK